MMDAAAEQKAEQLHYAEKYGVLASMMAKDCWAADSDYRGIGSTYDAARSAATHAFKARPDLRD